MHRIISATYVSIKKTPIVESRIDRAYQQGKTFTGAEFFAETKHLVR